MTTNKETLGDKIRGFFKSVFEEVAQAFADFLHAPIQLGMELMMDIVSKELGDKINGFMDKKVAEGKVSPKAKQEMDDLMGEFAGEGDAIIGFAMYMVLGPFIAAGLEPMAQSIRNESWGLMQFMRMRSNEAVLASFHDKQFEHYVQEDLGDQGFNAGRVEAMKEAYRMIPMVNDIRDLFLRGELGDRTVDELLARHGYTDKDRADLAKLFFTIPPLSDMVRFADYSAFDPEVIARWPEYFQCPEWLVEPFKKVGINNEPPDEWANRYWFSHFVQPGRFELGELHRRNLITDTDIKLAYKTMGYSGYWQNKLLELVKAIPTRVDVRRFWDLGTIDEARLREIYHAQGYYDVALDNYVTWTKINSYLPDAIQRWKNGWTTIDEIRDKLKELGMHPDRVEEVLETKVNSAAPERTAKERDLTKAEIVKGVKKNVITRDEGNVSLQAMGYSAPEAAYILAINVPEDATEAADRKRELSKSDILAGLKVGIIDATVALEKLLDIRYTPLDAAFILQIYEAVVGGEVEPTKREATKADILRAVRRGLISTEQAYSMLLEIGFSAEGANFILSVTNYEEPFSPHTPLEFQYLTEWYKALQGKPCKLPPNELILTEAAYVKARAVVDILKDRKALKKDIAKATKALRVAEYAHGQMLIKVNEANEKAQTEQ